MAKMNFLGPKNFKIKGGGTRFSKFEALGFWGFTQKYEKSFSADGKTHRYQRFKTNKNFLTFTIFEKMGGRISGFRDFDPKIRGQKDQKRPNTLHFFPKKYFFKSRVYYTQIYPKCTTLTQKSKF